MSIPVLVTAAESHDIARENAVFRKVVRRIVPFLILCYIFSYLDRVNVGFAKLQMSADLGFSEAAYGLGAGLFFIGYFLFEVPLEPVTAAHRRQHLDRPDHDHLGHRLRGVHVRQQRDIGAAAVLTTRKQLVNR
ncbi:hypothetical protein [Streptomyces capitiformicae]|uniref:Uncharacterized protein n=1 Tax=Streptomyces capitiformicae TaxID=2014920 RepID=A0A919DRQ8_9ACTN|nr:hypothetical protein [Streptomyces capitiformicae]GHE69551.1 hypothetical protein GCM10017771_93250 [Streptomyces capitiformicae]